MGTTATGSIGAGVDLPSGQSVTLTSRLARPVTGYASVANRGNLPDDLAGRASGGNAFFKVAYFDLTGNVTAGLLAGTYRTPNLALSKLRGLRPSWCGYRESNPGLKLGKLASYH